MVEVTLYGAWRDDLRGVQRRRGVGPAGPFPGSLKAKEIQGYLAIKFTQRPRGGPMLLGIAPV